jgi:dihydropteroate synthase
MDMFAPVLDCAGRRLVLDRPRVVGILNVTPDSFSDGGRHTSVDAAVAHALRMVEEGADMLDVGGESTRPGADDVPLEEELRRVIPVIEQLVARTSLPIAIDTSKPEVMRAAVGAGAGMINDVYALRREGALDAAAALGVPVCLMHMQGEPRTMQLAPSYADVVAEVRGFLAARVASCVAAGLAAERLAVDPGFGFGKTLEHNLMLLRRLGELAADGRPVLVGLSRKSMLGTLTGRAAGERVYGSVALAVIAALAGARIVRAHDVGATVEALKVAAAVQGEGRAA